MSKLRAFATHLAISAVVVGTLCALIFFVWYPGALFTVRGAWSALKVLLAVDLILGPLLTLIVYKPGKPSLRFDMSVIALIQLTALVYGGSVVYRERPYYLVFAVDRFEVVGRHEVDGAALDNAAREDPRLIDKPFAQPILVVAERPTDPEGFEKLTEEVLFEGKPDIEHRPEFWRTYGEHVDEVRDRLQDLGTLADRGSDDAARVARAVASSGRTEAALGFVPLIGRNRNFAMVVDRETGVPVDVLDIDPWQS